MDTGTLVVLVCCTLLLILSWAAMFLGVRYLMTEHRREKQQWEVERERLLNRAMTKEWTTYAQLVNGMVTSTSPSDEPPVGLNDEEELRRIGQLFAHEGLGDVDGLNDDLDDLGIRP